MSTFFLAHSLCTSPGESSPVKFARQCLLVLLLPLAGLNSAWAADVYNPGNNQLTIPSVEVSGTTYNNVVVTVGSVLRVLGGAPNNALDVYNPTNKQLNIPSVQVGNVTYTNVVITVGQVLSVGGVDDEDAIAAMLVATSVLN